MRSFALSPFAPFARAHANPRGWPYFRPGFCRMLRSAPPLVNALRTVQPSAHTTAGNISPKRTWVSPRKLPSRDGPTSIPVPHRPTPAVPTISIAALHRVSDKVGTPNDKAGTAKPVTPSTPVVLTPKRPLSAASTSTSVRSCLPFPLACRSRVFSVPTPSPRNDRPPARREPHLQRACASQPPLPNCTSH